MNNPLPEGLDQRFLKFIGVTEESERRVHTFYLKFFKPQQQVLDLGCGAGYFVKMLREQGVEAQGVDLDPLALSEARSQGIPVIQANALSYLLELPENSLDAIFSAHLVEHLEVEAVYSLIQEAYRVLKPGGFLMLVTPNVRAYVSHLELFWLHFDHKRFYHPKLLEFFMQDCQFCQLAQGENISELSNPSKLLSTSTKEINWDEIIPTPQFVFLRPWWIFKKWVARLIVLPYLHEMIKASIPLAYINRPFEVYVIGYKNIPDHLQLLP